MNWIDRLFGKKEEISEVRFEELPSLLDSKAKKLSDEIKKHASSIFSDIGEALEEIKESTAYLEEAEPEGRFHLKMVKLAKSNRDNMAKQVKMLLENINIPRNIDIAAIVTFHENALQTLTVCLENMMKSYQYTKLVFLEESKEVISDVNALGRLLNQIIEPINAQKNMLTAFDGARSIIQNIKTMESDIKQKEESIKENEKKIVFLKKEIEEKQKALAQLREGEPWKQYIISNEELVLLEENARRKEAEIKDTVSPLNKALNRLKQLSESGKYVLKPESKQDLNFCLSNPVKANPEFFVEFQGIVESGVLNLTPEKTSKTIEQAKFAMSSFSQLKNEYQALLLDVEKKKDELLKMSIAHEESGLAKDAASLQEKLAAMENELVALKNQVASFKHDIELKRQELQHAVTIIDSKIKVL